MSSNHAGAKSITTQILAPVLVDQSAANTLSSAADMNGYDRVKLIYNLGAMVNGAILSSWAVESNESNLGNNTNITGAVLTNITNVSNNNVAIIDIHRPTKRYVGVVVDAATANITTLSVLAERFRGSGVVPPTSPAQQYVSVQAN
jgi:hypothetical protein